MKPLRVIFMGSPEIAVPPLRALLESHHHVVGAVSQPDKPAGRGRELTPPAIAVTAKQNGLKLLQPEKVRGNAEFIEELKKLSPDVIAVVAYGKILPPDVLNLPPLGCINVHFSLLPKYRGAAPLQWALINGEEETGVTTFRLNEGVDTGPVLMQRKIGVHHEDNAEILGHRLSNIGAELLVETLDGLSSGDLEAVPQNDRFATHAPLLKKEDGKIDWTQKARAVWDKIRGMTPWPGTYTTWKGVRLKIHRADYDDTRKTSSPGEVVEINAEGLHISCSQGALLIKELQLEGGKRLATETFLKGHPMSLGERLGT